MKVLFVTHKPIFPLIDGGCIAMHAFLQNLLHVGCEIQNISISTSKHPFDLKNYPADLQKEIKPESVFINTKINIIKALQALVTSESYNVSRFYSTQFETLILSKVKNSDFDFILLESAFLLPYVDAIRSQFSGKIIVRTHNVEYKIWERMSEFTGNLLKKKYLQKLSKDLKNYEIKNLKKVDGLVCISDLDKRTFQSHGIHIPMVTIPVSMKRNETLKFDGKSNDIFFLGAMNWQPNSEAVDALLNEIFPKIRIKFPNTNLHLAGSYMPSKLLQLKQDGVVVHGRVENVAEFMAQHGILVVPLQSGSGIRIKILEAMAVGTPVIATKVGFEGIPVLNRIEGIVANSTQEICDAIWDLIETPALAKLIGEKGQKMIQEKYSQEQVSAKIYEFLQSF
ncbi:MAG: glycosyltransferase family 4 protein [Crocinitomicaceae bacterium]|nr:glycosyltransferase family 4 protein [Crocinitomicaceae bacterium]